MLRALAWIAFVLAAFFAVVVIAALVNFALGEIEAKNLILRGVWFSALAVALFLIGRAARSRANARAGEPDDPEN